MNFLLTIARKGSILPSNNKTYITCGFVEIGESYEQTNVLSDENEVNQQTKERVTFYVCRNFGLLLPRRGAGVNYHFFKKENHPFFS